MPGPMADWVRPVGADVLGRLVVISPHFDDAVLGCGQLLAAHPGATVVTVMGGQRPAGWARLTPWDALGGFRAGDDVVAARRREDAAALGELGAASRWLDFPDHQYDEPGAARPDPDEVGEALWRRLVDLDPTAVFMPLGLANPDHVLTHDAAFALARERAAGWAWFGYADAGYQHIPGMLAWRLARCVRAGLWPTPAAIVADSGREAKARALARYPSQLSALAEDWGFEVAVGARVAESYWRLAPPPAGWAGLWSND